MNTRSFKLPSGMLVTLRPMTVADENVLANLRSRRRAVSQKELRTAFLSVIERCIVSVDDAYPAGVVSEDGSIRMRNMLSGDVLYLMICLRSVSYPDGDRWLVKDVICPGCSHKFSKHIYVPDDLFVYELPEESKQRDFAKEPFETDVLGVKVQFVLETVATSDRMEKLEEQYPKRQSAAELCSKIRSVEGVEKGGLMDWIDGLLSAQAQRLREVMDAADCGVENMAEVVCDECGEEIQIPIPFGLDFFLPSMDPSTQRKKRRGRMRSVAPTSES